MSETTLKARVKLKQFNWGYLLVNASERPILYSDYDQLKKWNEIRIVKAGVFVSHYAFQELMKRGYRVEVASVGN